MSHRVVIQPMTGARATALIAVVFRRRGMRDVDVGFQRRLVAAGVPAGIVCALLVGARRSGQPLGPDSQGFHED